MIKLKRKNKPDILVNNEEDWKEKLMEAVSIYGGYSKIPDDIKNKLIVHYREKNIKSPLFDSSFQKCAFCETKPGESGNIEVEHFAPKSIYPELTFKWDNFLPVCRKCNGSKSTHDSLVEPIVNPYDDDPEEYFYYKDIRIAPIDNKNREIAKRTIDVCSLNSVRLMKPRADILISLNSFSMALEDAIDSYKEADTERKKTVRKRKISEALEAIESLSYPSEKFSGFCKEYLNDSDIVLEAKKIAGESNT